MRLFKMSSKIAQTLILVTINHVCQHMRTKELKTVYINLYLPTCFGNPIAIIRDLLNYELNIVYFNLGQKKGNLALQSTLLLYWQCS